MLVVPFKIKKVVLVIPMMSRPHKVHCAAGSFTVPFSVSGKKI